MAKNNKTFYIIIFFAFVITAISFRTYFKYASYNMDDYVTFEFAPADSSVLESCRATTDLLYRGQGRFQPVRLYIFVTLTHIFDEDSSVYYNFVLHLVNILLLFLLLRKFKAGSIFSLISVLLFAVFGRFRYMDSSSAMIGGSGLNLFFILLTFLFLIKSLEAPSRRLLKRCAYLFISFLAYVSLIFSYEVAVPLFVPLVVIFYLFNRAGKGRLGPLRTKKSFYLLLYSIPLFIYIVFFRLLVKVNYDGARIVWSTNIFIRLKSYILYTLIPPFELHMPSKAELVVLILYFIVIIMALKRDKSDVSPADKKKAGLRLFLFSALFYPSTVLLFTLNAWSTPSSVMQHHTYLMTAAGAMLLISFFYNLQWVLPAVFRRKYLALLVIFIFPVFLLNGEHGIVRHYKDDSSRVIKIRNIKKGIQSFVPDMDKTDAIIFKNFFWPYYDISSMDGALLKWFGFKKHIISGREIISVRGDNIVFRGPLHRYKKPKAQRVRSDRIKIFFVGSVKREFLPYHYFVDFERKLNLYQTWHVKEDWKREDASDQHRLEAILSNFKRNNYLNIWFKSTQGLQNFAKNHTSIEVNDELVPDDRMTLSGDRLSIDISERTEKINYFFLKILSSDDRFKSTVKLIALTKSIP